MSGLPLFPLGTVLTPGAELPLRVFEPRYVALLRTLLDGRDNPEFGVVAIRKGHEVGEGAVELHDVGCSAVLAHVEASGDGSYEVIARGYRRFRLERTSNRLAPFLVGDVTWLGEEEGDVDRLAELARAVRSRLLEYGMLVGREEQVARADGVGTRPTDAGALAHAVTGLVDLPLDERQALLACPTTQARLVLARRLVARECALARTLGAVPRPLDVPPMSAN